MMHFPLVSLVSCAQCFQQAMTCCFSFSLFSRFGRDSSQYSQQNLMRLSAGTLLSSLKLSLQNWTSILSMMSSVLMRWQASCSMRYCLSLMERAFQTFCFWRWMSLFCLWRWVMRNLREDTWEEVRALMEFKVLYLESQRVSSSSNLLRASTFRPLLTAFICVASPKMASLHFLHSSFFSIALSIPSITPFILSISSSLTALRKVSCEFSRARRSWMALSSLISLQQRRLTLLAGSQVSSFSQFILSSMALTAVSLLCKEIRSSYTFSSQLSTTSRCSLQVSHNSWSFMRTEHDSCQLLRSNRKTDCSKVLFWEVSSPIRIWTAPGDLLCSSELRVRREAMRDCSSRMVWARWVFSDCRCWYLTRFDYSVGSRQRKVSFRIGRGLMIQAVDDRGQ